MAENKGINLIAIKSLIEYIDNRDIAEGGIFLDDDNAEFVADILRYHYKSLTTEDKMEQVAAMNDFDKLFGRNGELVEERKKQVLAGALEIVQRYCDEMPNKMEVVAALFGKKLNEEFHFKVGKTVMNAKWTEMGLMSTDFAGRWWPCCYMPSLLTGQAVIIDE